MVTALPVTVLEVGLGQFTSQGAITAWNICPLLQGNRNPNALNIVVTWHHTWGNGDAVVKAQLSRGEKRNKNSYAPLL